MKASDSFSQVIEKYLQGLAAKDPLFAETFKKEGKSIKDCCNYIMETVKNKGVNVLTNDEVYGMAVHYYDEDDIKPKGNVSGRVVMTTDSSADPVLPAKKKLSKKSAPVNQPTLFG